MEVTRTNFQEVLPEIEEAIKSCSFIAIDTEFTGLTSGLESSVSPFDTPAEYYHKLKNGSLDFLIVQFGMATFRYNEEENKYTHKAYNFFVFPKSTSRKSPDCRFMCQVSSIGFLASNGFNFNKLFNEGITYLNKKDEDHIRSKLDESRERRKSIGEKNSSFVECPPEHKEAVNKAVDSIVEFVSSKDGLSELALPPANGFIRKLIYQEVWKKYTPDDLRIETRNGVMVVKRPATEKELADDEKKKQDEEEAEINEAVGFSTVIRLISQSRKLVVGHNMLLDLCHIIHRFCEPLPNSYQEFKQILHCLFPYILDTKFMCSTRPLSDQVQSSVLAHLLDTVSQPPFQLPTCESNGENMYAISDQKEHEAGYDAFITGIIAIALSNYLARHKKVKPISRLPTATSTHLNAVINRLFLMRVIDCYIDLDNDDPEPNRDAVFHVTFPEEWKAADLANMFSTFGGVHISWISSKSAYCGLYDKSQALKVKRHLVPAAPAGVTVSTFYAVNKLTQPSPVRRRSVDNNKAADTTAQPKRKHSFNQESSMKRPSVDPIPEEPEESENQAEPEEQQPRKKRKKVESSTKASAKDTKAKLFEEHLEW